MLGLPAGAGSWDPGRAALQLYVGGTRPKAHDRVCDAQASGPGLSDISSPPKAFNLINPNDWISSLLSAYPRADAAHEFCDGRALTDMLTACASMVSYPDVGVHISAPHRPRVLRPDQPSSAGFSDVEREMRKAHRCQGASTSG